mmetsp:Transcript_33373/g.80721  ORF Transcript_33373/g.80721 Transcript_33373/m.80721 type:complete len:349 (-) Transcript_33373:715-1761(-)
MYSANNVAAATSNGLATERNISNAASGPVTAVAGQPAIATKEEVICFSKDNEGHGSHTPLINLSTNPEDRLVELQKELAELKTNMDLIVNAKVEAKLKEISGRNTAAENSIRTTDMRSPENEKDSNKEEKAQCNRKAPINGPTNRDAATAKKIKGSKLLSGGSKDKKRGHRAMSRKNKKKLKRTNTESSDSASNREIKRFSDWLLNQPTVTPIEWQKQLQTIMIEKREKHNVKKCVHRIISKAKQCGTLRNCSEIRMRDVVNKEEWDSWVELIDLLLMCNIQIKDGKRKEEYTHVHCEVCLKAGKVEQSDHSCPYCHYCFYESWKERVVLLEDCCTEHCAPGDSTSDD